MNLIAYSFDAIRELGGIGLLPFILVPLERLPAAVDDDKIIAELLEASIYQCLCRIFDELLADIVFKAVP